MGRLAFACMVLVTLVECLQLGFSQLPNDQITAMNRVYEIFQNTTVPFVWSGVGNNTSPCSWKGVSCSLDNSSIIRISFRSFSMQSSEFLPVLCQIDTLESLDVSNNFLSSIPDAFFTSCGELSRLKLLNFSRNELSGPLPTFSGFRMVEILDFSFNRLVGEVNLQLNGLDSLKSLNLSCNRFGGPVPTNLGQSNHLEELEISRNSFTGAIPAELARYRNLSLIDLNFNSLTGPIPEEFGQLSRLEILLLSLNRLSGEIPRSLSNMRTLSRFAANQNNFNGTIPSGITSNLRSLDLSYNDLSGMIPSDLLSGPNLESLDLSYNRLEGSIPSNVSTSLFRLRLGSNSLTGVLPAASLRNLGQLMYLELDNNSFIGPLPPELGMCQRLALLDLSQNQFNGSFSPAFSGLTNLEVLKLQFNRFDGEILPQITQLTGLQKLNLSWNSMNGMIPSSIERLRNLTNLDLQGNRLSGQLPDSIARLSSLIELQLGNNNLSGPLPSMPRNLQIALNLSHNLFEGPIPRSLSTLTSLEVLDLSNNRFSGQIPRFLAQMGVLTHLLLSNNQLSGVRPSFPAFVVVDTEGNTGLSEPPAPPPRQKTPPPRQKRKSLVSEIIIAVPAAAVAVGLLIMIALFISRRYYRVSDEPLHSGEEASSPPEIIHGNLLTSHSLHKSNIDFRKTMEVVANPSNIILKTRFSTYYKAAMPSGARYFVKKLNWSDKIFQLGSHERFGEELEVLAKLCNSNVMIPLAYVLTEDSAYLFYDFAPKGTLSDVLHGGMGNSLDWRSRYSIAIGVAQGLAFLHGCNSGSILLLDLSSRSILLKSMNEPQIGDIELCKVIDPSKSTGSLSTVAGSVGYIPPEYAYTMRVTAAGNVYSFGVVLLELVTGKPAVSGGTELAKWVLSNCMQQNKLDHILDFSVGKISVAVRSQMLAVLKVALACVSISPDARPKMKSVLRMLLNAR